MHKKMWKLEQKADVPELLQLYVYGDVEGDGYDWWSDEIIESDTSANHFRNELSRYQNITEIEIYINSFGGSVFEGTAIYNQLRRHQAHKTVYIDGFACSIASVIAMAGDKIVMPRNAMMMIHHASMCCFGNATELRKAADDLDQINKGNRQAYLQKAGDKLTEGQLISWLDEEKYLTAEDCIACGLADEYAEKDADTKLMESMLQKGNLALQQQLKVRQSIIAQIRDINEPEPPAPEQKKNLLFLFGKL